MNRIMGQAILFSLLLTSFSAQATVIVLGGNARVLANGPGAGDDNLYTIDAATLPAWNSGFSLSASEDRVTSTADYAFLADSAGFQFDLSSHSATISDGSANTSTYPDDAATNVNVNFILSEATAFDFTGSFNAESPGGTSLSALSFVFLFNNGTASYETQEVASLSPGVGNALTYNYDNPSLGSLSGVLAAGNYTFTWESHISQYDDVATASGGAEFSFKVGSFTSVPEPSMLILLILGLTGLGFRKETSQKQTV